MSYLAGPAVRHKDGRPAVSRTGVDRILPSRPVQGAWQSPRRALRGPRTVENTDFMKVPTLDSRITDGTWLREIPV